MALCCLREIQTPWLCCCQTQYMVLNLALTFEFGISLLRDAVGIQLVFFVVSAAEPANSFRVLVVIAQEHYNYLQYVMHFFYFFNKN